MVCINQVISSVKPKGSITFRLYTPQSTLCGGQCEQNHVQNSSTGSIVPSMVLYYRPRPRIIR